MLVLGSVNFDYVINTQVSWAMKKPGCLGYIGDCTTQLHGHHFTSHYKDPCETTNRIQWKTRSWFQILFCFSTVFGEDFQFDEHVFQMGWFNHQPENLRFLFDICLTFMVDVGRYTIAVPWILWVLNILYGMKQPGADGEPVNSDWLVDSGKVFAPTSPVFSK